MRSIRNEKNLNKKKILLRLDLNVPLDNGKIIDTTRIDKILPTLNFLNQQNTKIIILSHVGRPNGKVLKNLSLKHSIKWVWVKGHAEDKYNNLADDLARRAIK